MFMDTASYQKYNDSNNFYFPAFFLFSGYNLCLEKGLFTFYNSLCGDNNWKDIMKEAGYKTEIKNIMEDFCFQFVNLVEINVNFHEEYNNKNLDKFNLNYTKSVINGVLYYFIKLIHDNPKIDYTISSKKIDKTEKIPKTGRELPKGLKDIHLEIIYFLRKGMSVSAATDAINENSNKKYSVKTINNYSEKIREILFASSMTEAVANFIERYGSIEFYIPEELIIKE